jgi:enamine deaminase RidA (YjgF/YER057c/UK114 family)
MAADGRLVVTGGVIGWDIQGQLPADFVAQVRQTLSNISAILTEGGARPEHLVRLTWYVVDIDEYLGESEGAGPDLSRDLRRALSGDGAGPGRAPG